jgi:SAM-dependent methyltransferase
VVAGLREEVFRKSQAEFWFNQVYAGYKSNFKPKRRFQNLEEWLKGDTLLDLGCGDGLTSYEIQQHGYRVYLSDVLDYRHPKAQGLPFQSMPNPHEIPFPRQNFDMALSFAVLHHVAEQDLLPLLSELRQRARRVIVEEDSYAVPREVRGYEQAYREDQQFRAYAHLPLADQVRYLMFVDYFANAITQGLVEMEIPFHFRSVGEWWEIFSKSGFEVKQTRLMGFQQGFFNRSCHVWFLLE